MFIDDLFVDMTISSIAATCQIECHGGLTRGQSVFNFGQENEDQTVVDIITEIDEIQFHQLLESISI